MSRRHVYIASIVIIFCTLLCTARTLRCCGFSILNTVPRSRRPGSPNRDSALESTHRQQDRTSSTTSAVCHGARLSVRETPPLSVPVSQRTGGAKPSHTLCHTSAGVGSAHACTHHPPANATHYTQHISLSRSHACTHAHKQTTRNPLSVRSHTHDTDRCTLDRVEERDREPGVVAKHRVRVQLISAMQQRQQ